MYILGISSYAHESSCALIKDGKILFVIEEERLNREKHTWKYPQNAIEKCLSLEGISIKDIEKITFFWSPHKEIFGNLAHVTTYFFECAPLLRSSSGGSDLSFLERIHAMRTINKRIKEQFSLKKSPHIEYIEHHLCHAANAFFVSPFKEAAILTIDGRGESTTTMLAIGKENKIEKIQEIKVPHSIGHLYAAVTDYLGFRPFFDEWKVMGMSAYGHNTFCPAFEDVIHMWEDGQYQLNLKYFKFHIRGGQQWFSEHFAKVFGPPRKKNDSYEQRHFDIAYALQKAVERLGVHIAQYLYEITSIPNLCMSGGVVLNCLMNKEIVANTPFKNFFIQPMASDAGTSVGSALYYYHQIMNKPRAQEFDNVYLGPGFNNEEIEEVLKQKKVRYKRSDNITKETAQYIANKNIVGWFQGRMEAGPRALGNRSIVVDPTDPSMKERLNERVKKREFFRPFAPSILEEKVNEYFEMPKNSLSPYMILTGYVKEDKRNVIPAVTHADNTARVQTVNKNSNPKYWQLIAEFEKITGVPVLLNTSFNENEPIVCTPEDAINCFLRTDFDILAIGDYIVFKS